MAEYIILLSDSDDEIVPETPPPSPEAQLDVPEHEDILEAPAPELGYGWEESIPSTIFYGSTPSTDGETYPDTDTIAAPAPVSVEELAYICSLFPLPTTTCTLTPLPTPTFHPLPTPTRPEDIPSSSTAAPPAMPNPTPILPPVPDTVMAPTPIPDVPVPLPGSREAALARVRVVDTMPPPSFRPYRLRPGGALFMNTPRKRVIHRPVGIIVDPPVVPAEDDIDEPPKRRRRLAVRRWTWVPHTLQAWRDEEGTPSPYPLPEATQPHPITDEPVSSTIPLLISRIQRQNIQLEHLQEQVASLRRDRTRQDLVERIHTVEAQLHSATTVTMMCFIIWMTLLHTMASSHLH